MNSNHANPEKSRESAAVREEGGTITLRRASPEFTSSILQGSAHEATRDTTANEHSRRVEKQECPPEVYIG